MNKLRFLTFFCLIFLSNALWAFIDISGTYTGTVTETVVICPDSDPFASVPPYPEDGNTYTTNVTIELGTPVDDGEGGFNVSTLFTGPGSSVSLPETDASSSLNFDGTSFFGGLFIYGNWLDGTYSNGTISGSGTVTSTSVYTTDCTVNVSFSLSGGTSAPATAPLNTVGTLSSTIQSMTSVVTSRINSILNNIVSGFDLTGGKPTVSIDMGRAAGDEFEGLSAWASYSGMRLDNNSAFDFDGDRQAFMFGMDYQPKANMVTGLMVSWETTDLDTVFNSGNVQADGYTIVPYFGMSLDGNWSMDALIGYGMIDIEQFHRGTGSLVTSSTDTTRLFAAANLNYGFVYDQFYLEGRGGITSADEQQDSYIESNSNQQGALRTAFTQLHLGGKATYLGFEEINPYIGLTYNYNASSNSVALFGNNATAVETDRDDMVSSVGFNWQKEENLSAGFEWTHRFMHKDFREDAIKLDIRMAF